MINDKKKGIILCFAGIGDALMTTPMIHQLKHDHPNWQLDIACMTSAISFIFKNNPDITQIHQLKLLGVNKISGWKNLRALAKEKYDFSILAYPAYRKEYHLADRAISATKRYGHSYTNGGFHSELHFLETDLIPEEPTIHNVENNLNLLKFFDINWHKELSGQRISYTLNLEDRYKKFGQTFIQQVGWNSKDIIGLQPGSGSVPNPRFKRWSIDNFTILANEVIKKGKKVFVFLGPDEQELGQVFQKKMGKNNGYKLITDLSFGESLGILSCIKVLVSNDNGFGHIANALKVSTISLFAATDEKLCGPYQKDIVTIIRPKNSHPWYRYELKNNVPPGAVARIDDITPKQVLDQLKGYV